MLRVVHLGKYYPPATGGIETHTQTLARAQTHLGADVRVVVVNHADAAGRDVTFERFARTPSATDRDGGILIHRAGRLANVAKLDVCPALPSLLTQVRRDFRPHVWHLHAPNITMMLAVLADRRIRPLVISHHSDIVRQKVLRHVVRPFEHALYRRAARVLSDSPPYIDGSDLLTRFRAKTVTLPLGLDLTPFRTPSVNARKHAARLLAEFTPPLWLSVGRLIYYKGLDTALDALTRTPGTLLVVGTGPMAAAWKAHAGALELGDRVRWLGRAADDELTGAYLAATALWFPSNARSEGFGLVQVEAMACGCPVVNTVIPASGVSWVCRHDVEGLTVPVNDPAAFAAAACRLVTEPGLRDRLSAAAVVRAAEFDWLTMGERSLDIYREVVR
jgi:rhamnosyl/mannosyltransferase